MRKALAFLLFLPCILRSQYNPVARNAFMNNDMQEAFDYWNISKPNTTFHSSFKPYLSSTFADAKDSAVPFTSYSFRNLYLSKTFNKQSEKRNHWSVQLQPLLDIEPGYEGLTKRLIVSGLGGAHVKLNYNNNLTFALSLLGGRTMQPFFLDTTTEKQRILPAYGKVNGNSNSGYSFLDYTGYISWSPNNGKYFNFQLGRDKHFIGDGYRSLLLSDFSPAYPFFRINTNIWRLQYNVWYTWMYDAPANGTAAKYNNKFGTFHYLSYNIIKQLNVGLFENIVWRGSDSNQVRTFEVNYLNPVIFFRPQEYSVGSPDNSFLGLNINATIFKKIKLYGQFAIDEFNLSYIRAGKGWWANKQGWQLGGKYINAFGVKGLKLQLEYNEVRPFTYSHGLVAQNYAHYGLPLAHPFGANFREFLGFASYRKDKWSLSWQGMLAMIGKDTANTSSNIGQNIFLSYVTRSQDEGNYTTQGVKTTVLQSQIKFTYLLNPGINLRFEAGYIQRAERNTQSYLLQDPYLFVGLKTSFWNVYNDY